MPSADLQLQQRVRSLERRLRFTQLASLAALALLVAAAADGRAAQQAPVADLVRARQIEILDDAGVVRIALGQDPEDTHRRSRACGITFRDHKGDERGGMGTMDDLSAVIALDAPHGVGGPMPDRIGMKVDADGSAALILIDNRMRVPVQLVADAQGGGGLELFAYDDEKKVGKKQRVSFAGEAVSEFSLDDGK